MHVLSAIAAAAEEPSKVPFYIIGGALAIAAVALSFVGLSQPEFPKNDGAQRAVIGVSALFVAAAIAAAILTSK